MRFSSLMKSVFEQRIHDYFRRISVAVKMMRKPAFLPAHQVIGFEDLSAVTSGNYVIAMLHKFCPLSTFTKRDAMLSKKISFLLKAPTIGHYQFTIHEQS